MCHTSPCTCTSALKLHDVRDTQALIRTIIRRQAPGLDYHQREALTAYLVERAWLFARDHYQPELGSFSNFLTRHGRRWIVDWQRQTQGRTRWQFAGHTYERNLPIVVPIDTTLGQPHTRGNMDPAEHSDPDLERVLTTRSGRKPRLADLGSRRSTRAAA